MMRGAGRAPRVPRHDLGAVARDGTPGIPVVRPPAKLSAAADRQVVLRDGARVRIRRSGASDGVRVAELYRRMSPDPLFQRFIGMMQPLVDWDRLTAADDPHARCTLLAEDVSASPPDLVAIASCESAPVTEAAEVTLLVRHGWQDRGLGTILFEALLGVAEARGIRRFRALVLAGNHRMLDMLDRCGAVESRSAGCGVIEIVFTRPVRPASAGTAQHPVRRPATS